MKKKRQYQKPAIETTSFSCLALLPASDNVGLITGEGSNAAKSGFGYFEDDDDMEE